MSIKDKSTGLAGEFKAFISRGSVVDTAIAFVMGIAFKTVIDAFAGDGKSNNGILGGILGAIFGGNQPNFNDKGVTINGSFIQLGSLLTATLNFMLIAVVLFVLIKLYNRFRRESPTPTTNEILIDIREELRKQQNS